MNIYSSRIIAFIHEIKSVIKDILSKEVRVKVTGNRFYTVQRDFSYPISVVIFNDKNTLGYFDPTFYELGFNERLMHVSKLRLLNIIRHELAHYICFINHKYPIQTHGPEFKAYCQSMGWGEDVYKASILLEEGALDSPEEESAILRKVKKLMALTASSNKNEAEQALIKSQLLLMKHNIDSAFVYNDDEEKIFLKRIMRQKKKDAKMRSIAKILETFFVNVVYGRAHEFTYLEIVGGEVNIEIAEYVADVLSGELDKLWNQTKLQHTQLKGMIAKNSFLVGVAKGYCDKIKMLKREYRSDMLNGLMVLEKKLVIAKEMVYPRLSICKSGANYCHHSATLGEQMGRQLNINPAIDKTQATARALIDAY